MRFTGAQTGRGERMNIFLLIKYNWSVVLCMKVGNLYGKLQRQNDVILANICHVLDYTLLTADLLDFGISPRSHRQNWWQQRKKIASSEQVAGRKPGKREMASKNIVVSFERDSKTMYVFNRTFTSVLFREIIWLEISSGTLSWIFVTCTTRDKWGHTILLSYERRINIYGISNFTRIVKILHVE